MTKIWICGANGMLGSHFKRLLTQRGVPFEATGSKEMDITHLDSVSDFVRSLNLKRGVTGYSLHVVPVALYAWLRHPDEFRTALAAALDCGGDTDTVGAILGALAGVVVGKNGIPIEWLNEIWEWPRSVSFMGKIAANLAEQTSSSQPVGPVSYFWPAIILRNFVFIGAVLVHGFRRLAPPY